MQVRIVGEKAAMDMLTRPTKHVFRNYLRRDALEAVRKIAVPRVRAAAPRSRQQIKGHTPPGTLKSQVTARELRTRQGEFAAVAVGPKVSKGKDKAWYAHFVIAGVRPHRIFPEGQSLRFQYGSGIAHAKVVNHPGISPNPFVVRSAPDEEIARWMARMFDKQMKGR